MKFSKILFLFTALTCTNALAKDTATSETKEKRPNKPIVITGDEIQPLSDTHWRIKVSYAEASKFVASRLMKKNKPLQSILSR